MPLTELHAGPFSAVYVGLASGDSSDVLTQLFSLTTSEHGVAISQPETFNYSVNNSLQSGPVSITATLTFLSDDPDIVKLSMGNFLDAAQQDTPSEYKKLMLLLVHPDETADSSILIPTCYVLKNLKTNWDKKAPTQVPLTFFWQARNRYTPPLFYKRDLDSISTILGVRSPF